MDTIRQDLRYALRSLARSPLFLLVTVLTLALGIGATTVVFSLVNAVLLRPLPVPEASRVVSLSVETNGPMGGSSFGVPDYEAYRDGSDVFTELAAMGTQSLGLRAGDGAAEPVSGGFVSGNYFRMLGIRPEAGRFILPDEDRPGGDFAVAVLSHQLWRGRFAADPAVVGRPVELNGQRFTVVGVAPEGFTGTELGSAPDVWVPLAARAVLAPHLVERPMMRISWLQLVGRLKPGVGVEQAEAPLGALARSVAESEAGPRAPRRFRVTGMALTRAGTPPPVARGAAVGALTGLFAAAALVLLIASTNVAGMLLARATARRREMGVRLALGAGTARLVRQLVTESVVLFLIGGAAGVLLTYWVAAAAPAFQPPIPGPGGRISLDLQPDARVLGFGLLLSLATGIVFGLAPALQAARPRLVPAMKDSAPGSGRSRSRLRDGFVVGQIAMTMLLLLGAGLLMRALQRASSVDPGFDPSGVALVSVDLEPYGFGEESGREFLREMMQRVRALPGVESATLAHMVPLTGATMQMRTDTPQGEEITLYTNVVGDEYFSTLRIPLRAGRDFDERDVPGATRVVVVNEALARRFWPGQNPIGQKMELGSPMGRSFMEVVGVVADSKYARLDEGAEPVLYEPMSQSYFPRVTLHVRGAGSAGARVPLVRRELQAMRRELAVVGRPMEEEIAGALLPQRMGAATVGGFGLVGLLLAAVGLYGVLAYSVAQRTREIGIRTALGARARDTVRLVLRHALLLVAAGVAIGGAAGLGLTRHLSGLLFGVSPSDPVTFAGVATLLLLVAMLASYLPARRATRVDPTIALRAE